MLELSVCSGVVPCSISDHDILYIVLKHPHKSKTQPRVIIMRHLKKCFLFLNIARIYQTLIAMILLPYVAILMMHVVF